MFVTVIALIYNGKKMVKCNGEYDEWYHIKCIYTPITRRGSGFVRIIDLVDRFIVHYKSAISTVCIPTHSTPLVCIRKRII